MGWRGVGLALVVAAGGACSDPSAPGPPEGDLLWRVESSSARTLPLVLNEQVLFGSQDGSVFALWREGGGQAWRTQLNRGRIRGSRLLSSAGVVVVPAYELWAVDPASGGVLWSFGGPDGAAGTRDGAVSGDTIFAASALGWASSLDAATGQAHWSVDLGESVFSPVVAGDRVLFATRGFFGQAEREGPLGAGHIVALRRSDGEELWRFELPDSVGFPLSGGAVSAGVVWEDQLIVSGKAAWVYAVRIADGELLWSRPNGDTPPVGGYHLPPTILGDVAVLSTSNNRLEGWDVRSGDRRWSWDVPTTVTPAATWQGYVFAFDGPVTVGTPEGAILSQTGGLGPSGGVGYFNGTVAPDGTMYTLGNAHFTEGGGVYIYSLRPPVAVR